MAGYLSEALPILWDCKPSALEPHGAAAMGSLSQKHHIGGVENSLAAADAARVYNQAADGYLAYADGDTEHLFSFEGHHAYADRYVWSVLDTKLRELRRSGATSITILDAGCGPGTWTRRLVTRAGMLGFSVIRARGFDVRSRRGGTRIFWPGPRVSRLQTFWSECPKGMPPST